MTVPVSVGVARTQNAPTKNAQPTYRRIPELRPEILERYWARVTVTDPDSCWLWNGFLSPTGYAYFSIRKVNYPPHRVSYAIAHGSTPQHLQVDHLCKVRHCMNPAHLEAVPQRVNNYRSDSPVGLNARKTHCVRGHEFTDANTLLTPRGGRGCRACKNAGKKARRDR